MIENTFLSLTKNAKTFLIMRSEGLPGRLGKIFIILFWQLFSQIIVLNQRKHRLTTKLVIHFCLNIFHQYHRDRIGGDVGVGGYRCEWWIHSTPTHKPTTTNALHPADTHTTPRWVATRLFLSFFFQLPHVYDKQKKRQ